MPPEPTFTPHQKEVLEHKHPKAIYDFLCSYDKPASLGEIAEGIEVSDLAIAFRFLAQLVDVGLVEKVLGTNLFRAVER